MTYLVLDVETVPRAPAQTHLEIGKALDLEGLWDSPRDKLVGEWLAKHERVKPGLHPLFSEVAVVSWEHGQGGGLGTLDTLAQGSEDSLLHAVSVPTFNSSLLVTYNGFGFDLPLLNQRLRLNGLPILPFETNPWHHALGSHYDVMLELAGGAKDRFPYVPLDVAYAVVMEKEPPERPDLEAAQAAWWRGDPVPLRTRCQADVGMTGELYRRLVGQA